MLQWNPVRPDEKQQRDQVPNCGDRHSLPQPKDEDEIHEKQKDNKETEWSSSTKFQGQILQSMEVREWHFRATSYSGAFFKTINHVYHLS